VAPTLVHGAQVLKGFRSNDDAILLTDAAVLVEDGLVGSIAPYDELRSAHPDAVVIGGPRHVVIPGLVNAHHHVGLTPLQLGSPDLPLELWFASRLAQREVDPYLDTLYSAFEMIASGVTTVQHLHSRAPGTAADVAAAGREVMRAYREIGMRASYSTMLRDQNRLVYEADRNFVARLPRRLRPAVAAHFERFTIPFADQLAVFDELHREHTEDPLIRVQLAPANLHWLSDEALLAVADVSRRTGVPAHMHLLETPYQKVYAIRRTGGSALAHIHRFGLTGPTLTIGHGVWMTDSDIDLLAETGTHVCHNCSSNFRLKSGMAPVNRFRGKGIPVAIGMDEAGINDDRDMLQEMRLVLRAHREPGVDAPQPSPSAVLRMATEHGAATTPFATSIGQLSPGHSADLVVLDWEDVTYPYQDPDIPLVDVLVQRAKTSAVQAVMIAGEVVYSDGAFTRVDREAVLGELAARLAAPMTRAEENQRMLATSLMPHVRRFYDGYLADLAADPHYRMSGRS
jgi:5-methylthioadenosine/S-adenosylhomocysteine deaminase